MIELLKMISKDNSRLCTFHSVWKNPTAYFVSLGECTITVMDILLVNVENVKNLLVLMDWTRI